jgi:hypothetical protein
VSQSIRRKNRAGGELEPVAAPWFIPAVTEEFEGSVEDFVADPGGDPFGIAGSLFT